MEAHPIPQNVTSFEFHLIGDMTIKQFGYLAVGITCAYITFVFFSVNYPLVSWPLIFLFSALGFAFAFLPIGSRPLDYWLNAFLKAIYSPTKRAWRREGKTYEEDPLFNSRLQMYLPSFNPQVSPVMPNQMKLTIDTGQPLSVSPANQPQVATSIQPLPTPEQLNKTVELARQAQTLQVKIIQTERQLSQLKTQNPSQPGQISQPQIQSADYPKQVNTILEELQKLLNQATGIKQQMAELQQPIKQPEPVTPTEAKSTVKVKVTVPTKPKQTQLALTSFPNVINGIIKDAAANYLDSVIVVIHDKEGMPVRALKTNKLGQFSGSTPLPNGIYTMEIEKEGYNFDVLQIELEGQIIPPLTITAKG